MGKKNVDEEMHLESIEYELMDFGTEISCSKTFCPANATSHGILLRVQSMGLNISKYPTKKPLRI